MVSDIDEAVARTVQEWENLLRGFEALAVDQTSELQLVPQFSHLLDEFGTHQAEWREEQKSRADDFNFLGTMKLTRKELCHSDILAWLLDSTGTHAQGSLGFRLFLTRLWLPEDLADKNYEVFREVSGDESRLDIVIEAAGQFLIAIENKIDSEEGEDQTNREWRDLEKRKIELNIQNEIIAFFLTPGAQKPACPNFRELSWQTIAEVFRSFSDEAKAEIVKIFARHYAETIMHEIATETKQ